MAHKTSREGHSGADTSFKRRKSEGPIPKLYTIFHGEVASVREYGLFVKIPGTTRQGLCHKSQISHSKVEDPSEMFSRGEYVYCKVISMDDDGEKIGLAMKMVNQTTGIDQDPNNVELSQDEKKRRQFGNRPERQKIVLEAVLDTTCKKCGGTGHLAQDCFKMGETSYELIPDLDDYMKTVVKEEGTSSHSKKNKKSSKKSKKEKKEKKVKKRKRLHSSSGSSSTSEDSDSHKKSKRKKKKKMKRYSSSSDSG